MPAKKLNKKNCCFLYGEDLVSLALRREGLLKAYFEGDPPDPVLFDGEGSLEEYENALSGQSLFSSATAVVIHNPPFLKRISKAEKEEKAALHFVERLEGLQRASVSISPHGRIWRMYSPRGIRFPFPFCRRNVIRWY